MRWGVIVFPGSNCDRDVQAAVLDTAAAHGVSCDLVWHSDLQTSTGFDAFLLPGGFSYGDYLRCGAIAGNSPAIDVVREAVQSGKLVIGICNGFQILTESGILPGALVSNASGRFICKTVDVEVLSNDSPFTNRCTPRLKLPVAHGEGNYQCDAQTLLELKRDDRICLRYVTGSDINGSVEGIAGILGGPSKNVLGLMPHPERATMSHAPSSDGRLVFESMIEHLSLTRGALA